MWERAANASSLLPFYDRLDFNELAHRNPDFERLWSQSHRLLDHQDPDTCRTLSKAILETGFGIRIDLPDDRLCPPVPNRCNYVAWIQRLLDSTSPDYSGKYDPNRKVVGLDIGTGASAIYALLALKSRPNWTMCVTDVDKKSFDSAARNLALNDMMTRVKMLQTTDLHSLIPLQYLGVDYLDFTICNPPFFVDETEMRASLKGEGKSGKPNSACTGSVTEMVYPGGDLGFVTAMVNESLLLREKVTWYSSLLGKLDSAKAIIDLLKKNGLDNWAVGCLEQGVTKRWIVAWSFGDLRPSNDIARIDGIAHEYLPFPTRYRIPLTTDRSVSAAKDVIDGQLADLDLRWSWDAESSCGIAIASQNVWNRAYRRQSKNRLREKALGSDNTTFTTDGEIRALVVRISIHRQTQDIVMDWLQGRDVQLWESFCGMLRRSFKRSVETSDTG